MNINIECLKNVCDELSLNYEFIDDNQNFIRIDGIHDFINFITPFNTEAVTYICKDKYFTYKLLNDSINMPHTKAYLSPYVSDSYKEYLSYKTTKDTEEDICNEFNFPLIIKKNSGSMGNNVFKCINKESVVNAIETIFNKNSYLYDYVALAQEYINISKEFRVVMFDKKIIFMYEKDIQNAEFTGNLSPLHWKDSRAILIKDKELIQKVDMFIKPIFEKLNLKFAGLDIAVDNNKMYLIEVNTKPAFGYFIKDNGTEELKNLYRRMLNDLVRKN